MTSPIEAPERLEACPFCGGHDLVVHQDISEDAPHRVYAMHVFCRDCHCHGRNNFPIGWAETEAEAVAAWNRRSLAQSSLDAPGGVRVALQAIVDDCLNVASASYIKEHLLSQAMLALNAPSPTEQVSKTEGAAAQWFQLSGDARLGSCASEGCGGQPTWRLEAGGVGSDYCSGCRAKIEAIGTAPAATITDEQGAHK